MQQIARAIDGLLANQKKVGETYGIERAIRGQIAELVAKYDNPESLIEDEAVGAALAGRPAFWKRTGYSNSTVGLVCADVNMGLPLMDALARWAKPDSVHGTRAAILAELIPLNITAVLALDDARARSLWSEAETRNVERVAR